MLNPAIQLGFFNALCQKRDKLKKYTIVGDYTYHGAYETNGEDFENHVTNFYPLIGDK